GFALEVLDWQALQAQAVDGSAETGVQSILIRALRIRCEANANTHRRRTDGERARHAPAAGAAPFALTTGNLHPSGAAGTIRRVLERHRVVARLGVVLELERDVEIARGTAERGHAEVRAERLVPSVAVTGECRVAAGDRIDPECRRSRRHPHRLGPLDGSECDAARRGRSRPWRCGEIIDMPPVAGRSGKIDRGPVL